MKKFLLLLTIASLLVTGAWASGTAAGTSILAASINIVLEFGDGSGGTTTKNASLDGIEDAANTVAKISGIIDKGISTVLTETTGVYKGLVPSESYTIDISLRNNGNDTDDVVLNATLTGTDHWSIVTENTLTLAEDQLDEMTLTIQPSGAGGAAFAYERATVNTTVELVDQTAVVSYNPFADAYKDVSAESFYGGVASFSNEFVFEAMGYNLMVLSRTAEVVRDPVNGALSPQAIPGAIIKYTIVIKNESSAPAIDVTVRDNVPGSTHLYAGQAYSDIAADEANLSGASVTVPDVNQATGTISFSNIDIDAYGSATVNYTVTID